MSEGIDRQGVNGAPMKEPSSAKTDWQAPTLTLLGDAATLTAGTKIDATSDGVAFS